MSRPHRFHFPDPDLLREGAAVPLPPAIAHQVTRVLRARVGDRLILFPGDGSEYEGELTSISPAMARVGAPTRPAREAACSVHVAVTPLKGEKLEWVLQKLTELGVARVSFLAAERAVIAPDSERWERRRERYERILSEAAEQSGRVRVPQLGGTATSSALLAGGERPAFLLDPGAETALADRISPPPATALLLVGPEGGFTAQERDAALAGGATAVQLGPRILRAETAAVAAAALFTLQAGAPVP